MLHVTGRSICGKGGRNENALAPSGGVEAKLNAGAQLQIFPCPTTGQGQLGKLKRHQTRHRGGDSTGIRN